METSFIITYVLVLRMYTTMINLTVTGSLPVTT